MSNQDQKPKAGVMTSRIAVTVLVDAEGIDVKDCRNIAVMAIGKALAEAGDALTFTTTSGVQREAHVRAVIDIATALRQGVLTIAPAGEAQ